jgi:hypothetical protein
MYIDLEVVPKHMRSDMPIGCAVCGPSFVAGRVIAYAVSDAGMEFGPVCPKCIEGGPREIAQQLMAQAELLRVEAAVMEEVAAEVIVTPTPEDLTLMEQIAALKTRKGEGCNGLRT